MVETHFSPKEFNYPDKVDDVVLLKLYNMRKEEALYQDIQITINEDYAETGHTNNSLHGRDGVCRALDIVIRDSMGNSLPILEQFFIALRYNWTGIGFYPYWITPGLHVESDEAESRKGLWYRDAYGVYKSPLQFIKEA